MWQDQLKPTLGEIVAMGEKIQTHLMDFTESCPASVFEKIVRASDPQEEPGMMPADYEDLKRPGRGAGDGEHTVCDQHGRGDRDVDHGFVWHAEGS